MEGKKSTSKGYKIREIGHTQKITSTLYSRVSLKIPGRTSCREALFVVADICFCI